MQFRKQCVHQYRRPYYGLHGIEHSFSEMKINWCDNSLVYFYFGSPFYYYTHRPNRFESQMEMSVISILYIDACCVFRLLSTCVPRSHLLPYVSFAYRVFVQSYRNCECLCNSVSKKGHSSCDALIVHFCEIVAYKIASWIKWAIERCGRKS